MDIGSFFDSSERTAIQDPLFGTFSQLFYLICGYSPLFSALFAFSSPPPVFFISVLSHFGHVCLAMNKKVKIRLYINLFLTFQPPVFATVAAVTFLLVAPL